jgi:glycosyltransferase 2 family protein
MLTKKNIISSILSLCLGFFLVWLILRFTEVDFEQIITTFYSLNPLYTGLAIATLILHTWLTGYKWKLVTEKITPNNKQSLNFYFLYTTLGSLTMQFMPQYVGMVMVQNLALRVHKISSFSKGFLSVIYDQFFNFLIPFLLFPPAMLYIFGYISLSVTVFASTTMIILTHFLIKKWHRSLILFLIKAYSWVKQLKPGKAKSTESELVVNDSSILSKQFTIELFWISVVRYAVWIIRGVFIAIAGSFKIKLGAVIFVTPIVQLAMLLSFTPANLGLMELSWIGLLRLFNVPNADAVEFSLMQRFLYIAAVMIVLAVFLVVWLVERFSLLATSSKK